jgi:solute carrier family 45, member 1/2/4
VATLIFKVADGGEDPDPTKHTAYLGKTGVAWVLRFGGVCTIAA